MLKELIEKMRPPVDQQAGPGESDTLRPHPFPRNILSAHHSLTRCYLKDLALRDLGVADTI